MSPQQRKAGISFLLGVAILGAFVLGRLESQAQQPSETLAERFQRLSDQAERPGLAEPFKGITTDGKIVAGLFPVRSTGVSTGPVREAAAAFLAALTPEQQAATLFPVDDVEWRKWMNQHFYIRQGVSFKDMSPAQREAALGVLRASLSAKGLRQSQDIMRLNHTLGELNNNDFEQYGEQPYWITMMGQPSAQEPWGWQIDGHHLVVNYFVLGDQVVMTPTFMGSEPVIAPSGKFKGTTVLQSEQDKGLALINALDDAQRRKAIIQVSKTGGNNLTEAFKDNIVLDYAGVRASEFSEPQRERLLDLVAEHVGNMRDDHAKVKMSDVREHLGSTYFAWIGDTKADSVFYYRVHSPVILVEFDHQPPIALPGYEKGKSIREHIHTVVRTPNGNDYGKDLLRQHYEKHPHRSR